MRLTYKKLIFLIFTIIIMIAVTEFAMQVACLVSLKADFLLSRLPRTPVYITDEKLGSRPNPAYPDHDRKGFRNNEVPSRVSIVAMGDSQTYGTGVRREEAWPQQLGRMGRMRTYNMAFGGYGTIHSLILFNEAMDMKPEAIIFAFYPGNDLIESYYIVYKQGQETYLKTKDENAAGAIIEKENMEPIDNKIGNVYSLGNMDKDGIKQYAIKMRGPFSVREFLAKYSKFYGLLRTFVCIYKNDIGAPSWDIMKKEALTFKDYYMIYDKGEIKTIFTPSIRLCTEGLQDPRIAEGLHMSLEAMEIMRERAQKSNVKFLVLFLPTKELVFKDIVYENSKEIPDVYKKLIGNEQILWRKTGAYLKSKGIPFIDSLPYLRQCLRSGKQPYRISADGHPNAIGQRTIAAAVLAGLGEYCKRIYVHNG